MNWSTAFRSELYFRAKYLYMAHMGEMKYE